MSRLVDQHEPRGPGMHLRFGYRRPRFCQAAHREEQAERRYQVPFHDPSSCCDLPNAHRLNAAAWRGFLRKDFATSRGRLTSCATRHSKARVEQASLSHALHILDRKLMATSDPTVDRLARMLADNAGVEWSKLSEHPGYNRYYWRERAETMLAMFAMGRPGGVALAPDRAVP